ncbi:MAG: YggS family pyridoxal phosphate-dependent enzyme [Massilibacteroides sp.]|nr:YggS family pyridoxal phosphate-dependent enzyme [Massilibacteroides sp.]
MNIASQLNEIRQALPEKVKLLAVSKFHPLEKIQEAYDADQRIFGESRAQELKLKAPALPKDIEWHFIGPLQRNKVKDIVPFVHTIQSVDSLKLLQEIDKQATKYDRIVNVFLEVHIAEESQKHGFSSDEVKSFFENGLLNRYPHIQVTGLMGIATQTQDPALLHKEFKTLHNLFKTIGSLDTLSMGMSSDYPIAIEEGSTLVRIGTAIFGPREY